jgi:hypothetical protein
MRLKEYSNIDCILSEFKLRLKEAVSIDHIIQQNKTILVGQINAWFTIRAKK